MQSQPPPQSHSQIDATKLAGALDPHSAQVHLAPERSWGRGGGLAESQLVGRCLAVEQGLQIRPALGERFRAIELAQVCDELMSRPTGRADGFDQRPVIVAFASHAFAMTPQEHARSVNPKRRIRQRALLHYIKDWKVQVMKQRGRARTYSCRRG